MTDPDHAAAAAPAPVGVPRVVADRGTALGREATVGAVIALVVAVLGVPAAALWSYLAPHAVYEVVQHQTFRVSTDKALFGDDAYFFIITGVAGLLCGLVVALLVRRRGVGVGAALGLVVGGGAAAVIAWQLGPALSSGVTRHALAALPDQAKRPVMSGIRATGVIFAWPLAAVLVHLVVQVFRPDGDVATARGSHPGLPPPPPTLPPGERSAGEWSPGDVNG